MCSGDTHSSDFSQLKLIVQKNCAISDANYAGNYALCIYLLKMRELFRSKHDYKLTDPLPQKELGNWISEQEKNWESLENTNFLPLILNQQTFDPFDNHTINTILNPYDLVYSAGFGRFGKPSFFLGKIRKKYNQHNLTIIISDIEYARDLSDIPASLLEHTILIREPSVRRVLWDKIESTNWNKQNTSEHNPLKKALASYEFSDNAEHALNNMTRTEIDTMILHEQGESLAGRQLEPEWANMLNDAGRSKAEIIIRAVRDLLADCLITLPTLLENHHTLALYGYFSHFSGMRKTLFPMLDKAYQHWQTHNTLQPLNHAISTGQKHWLNTATQLLDIYQTQHSQWHKHIGNLESTIICH